MGYVFSSPAGLITLFSMAVELVIGLVLALSNGLSELHKDLLVAYAIGFPTLVLVILLVLLARAETGPAPAEVTLPESP